MPFDITSWGVSSLPKEAIPKIIENFNFLMNAINSTSTTLSAGIRFRGVISTYADLVTIANIQNGDGAVVLADETRAMITDIYVYDGKWKYICPFTITSYEQNIVENISNVYTKTQTDEMLELKADLDSPTLTGIPTAPTPATGDDSQRISTTKFVQTELNPVKQDVTQLFKETTNLRQDITILQTTGSQKAVTFIGKNVEIRYPWNGTAKQIEINCEERISDIIFQIERQSKADYEAKIGNWVKVGGQTFTLPLGNVYREFPIEDSILAGDVLRLFTMNDDSNMTVQLIIQNNLTP